MNKNTQLVLGTFMLVVGATTIGAGADAHSGAYIANGLAVTLIGFTAAFLGLMRS